MRFLILATTLLLAFGLKGVNADDTELFVADLPEDAQANVVFIMDTSGSMQATPSDSNGRNRMRVAKDAAKEFVQQAQNMNFTLMSFNGAEGAKVDFASKDIEVARQDMLDAIEAIELDPQGKTPISESLYEAYHYLSGRARQFASATDTSLEALDLPANPSQTDIDTANYLSPITNRCQKSHVILFTDGRPENGDDVSANSNIRNLLSGLTLPVDTSDPDLLTQTCDGDGECLEELAWYMANNDIKSDLDGDQPVMTHTIAGFTNEPAAINLLTKTAHYGKGRYYHAGSVGELSDVLEDLRLRVNAEDSLFVSAASSTSAFNALQTADDIYFAMFKPNIGPGWTGNLKRYRLGEDNQIYDANDRLAIDPLTGFFSETAQSFWSASVDGKDTNRGGVAEKMATSSPVYSNATAVEDLSDTGNRVRENNLNITETMLGLANGAASERTELLRWGQGIDIDDIDNDGSTTDYRTTIGDAIHTEPQVVTYYKNRTQSIDQATGVVTTQTELDKTLYFTTNDGYLRAINTDDGSTEFSFVPQALLKNFKPYREGYTADSLDKVYGLDGPMGIWFKDTNGDGDVLQSNNGLPDANEHVYLYLTMRRGGRNIYALDVTDRSRPKLKWIIKGGEGAFSELGQTWSAPQVAQVKWGGTEKTVLFFGGGYDSATDDQTTVEDNTLGRAIYMVDAASGDLLWRAGRSGADLSLSDIRYSIAADLTLLDINQDGNLDYFFAADVGGRIFRFDINQNNTLASNFATGGMIADFSSSGANAARRFFEAVDVSKSENQDHLYIAAGSGFRAHPLLAVDANNRMYVIKDPNVTGTPSNYKYDNGSIIRESSLYNVTNNLVQDGTDIEQETALSRLNSHHGWYIKLDTTGQKVLSQPRIYKGALLFTTYTPRQDSSATCGPLSGLNHFYAVNIENGASILDLHNNGAGDDLNRDDRRIELLSGALAPSPSILSRSNQGAEICVGTECFQNTLQSIGPMPVNRNFWRENE